MKTGELRELYQMMFLEYPDIVTVKELREMLGISRKLAYKLIDYGVHSRREDRHDAEDPENQRHQLCDGERGEEGWMRSSA